MNIFGERKKNQMAQGREPKLAVEVQGQRKINTQVNAKS